MSPRATATPRRRSRSVRLLIFRSVRLSFHMEKYRACTRVLDNARVITGVAR